MSAEDGPSTSIQTTTTRPSPRTLTSLPEILSALSLLQAEERDLSASLTDLLNSEQTILDALDRLQCLAPQLDELQTDAILLHDRVSATAKTADRVGGRVRLLDEEMRRVRLASERVGHVMELKTSLTSLHDSISNQDWESATRHCSRAMALPIEVISGPFAEATVPSSDLPLPPVQTLQAAREQLLEIFTRQFMTAAQARDSATTSRFFKLFPAIGWEKEGLDVYSSFVSELLQTKAPPSAKTSSPLYYVTALTALFESVCNIVDQHQPVVEKYYGPGQMVHVVEKLLQECDQVVKRLVSGWEEERSMKRKIADTVNARRQLPQTAEDEMIDPREIDKVLTEVAGMLLRFTAFRRFLYDNLLDESEDDDEHPRTPKSNNAILTTPQPKDTPLPPVNGEHAALAGPSTLPHLPLYESSGCQAIFLNLLSSYYIPLEVWYLRSTISQAHRMSSADTSTTPPTTTVPDIAFYLLKLVLNRMLGTGSLRAVEGTHEQIRDVMEREYVGVIKRKLDDVYRNASAHGGGARASEKAERENRLGIITHLNDLDISASHMERLIKDVLSSEIIAQNFMDQEQKAIRTCVSSMLTLVPKIRSTLKAGIEQVFNQLMRPRLRTLLSDVYKDVSYLLDESSYATSEYQDIVRKRFVKAWETLTDGYKDWYTDNNFRQFFGLAVDVLVRPWEKFVLNFKYTELGAIRFDRDIRAISTYLSSQTAFGDSREKFQKLLQISTLLNLDKDEDVDEFFSGSGVTWKLSITEARAIVSLKVY